ncbi:RICIN domain-containing protein [Actinoallomurus rhizosphaericola]|uniref:RICIN domain-containing protein n=1 Tax=Actinoallomurus rhizosphaericola TaxID=2952536 RepID=UPI002092DC37|nr:ricin-type beta-trefoil lectin domain protein [Actinoallomurus rhizosphaericola]MCO5999959.1 RICIN domain-containing protein [Actinoallomurus rhizosphaericola]
MLHRVDPARPPRSLTTALCALITLAALLAGPAPARAAGESVNIWLTTTDDSGGRHVTRGLQQQTPITFGSGGSAAQTITVDENTRYQRFTGAGASFTDTAAWLLNSSGALSSATRTQVMQKLFDPSAGIGLSFLRNPMGASDLARYSYSFDDMPAGQTDPGLAHFSIAHDLADVVPLTKQARQLNPALTVMGTPWSAPAWMKDNGDFNNPGWLQAQYYGAYAQYFVKYLQAYEAQGVHVDLVTAQNEPTCCNGYPSMSWNGSGLDYFTKTNLLPALHAAGLTTKVLALDWNWDTYDGYGAPTVDDATIRNDSLFGGIAWHGYGGDVTEQSIVHAKYPAVDAYDTEHSGGTWIGDQQKEDMHNIVDYTRNWGKSVVKWSLAVDQNMGPHNGGCGTCTGLVTVHNGDSRSGQVDYTIEYYDLGHLTKFVRPGAYRIASTANTAVPNVAWQNPDGSKALIAYNDSGSAQSVKVVWGAQSFVYSLPAHTTATFTWNGTQSGGGATGQISGYGGKCVDVAGANSANGTAVQLYDCNGTAAQQWTVGADGTIRALGKCMDLTSAGTANGTQVQLYDCNGTGAQQWTRGSGSSLVNPASGRCLDATGPSSANGTRLQIWDCTGAANQQWTLPS